MQRQVDNSEKVFSRSVQITDKTRVKQLKALILEDMEMKDSCAIRLYTESGEPLVADMDFCRAENIERVEAELFYLIQIAVEGMGG